MDQRRQSDTLERIQTHREQCKVGRGRRPWARAALSGYGDSIRRGDLIASTVVTDGGEEIPEHNGLPMRVHYIGKSREKRVYVIVFCAALKSALTMHVEGAGWRRRFAKIDAAT